MMRSEEAGQPISGAASLRQGVQRLDPDHRPRLPGQRPFSGDLGTGVCRGAPCFEAFFGTDHAATGFSWRKSAPSFHMRCSTTPSLRASATLARRAPRRRATAMPHVFSADHALTRVMITCAASNKATRTEASRRGGGGGGGWGEGGGGGRGGGGDGRGGEGWGGGWERGVGGGETGVRGGVVGGGGGGGARWEGGGVGGGVVEWSSHGALVGKTCELRRVGMGGGWMGGGWVVECVVVPRGRGVGVGG